MTLNDGHTFVEPEKLEEEFKSILKMMMEVYRDNITDYRFRCHIVILKMRKKYFDDDDMWEKSQAQLKRAMDDLGLDYYEAEGEAAFYGPKLDVKQTTLGNEETMSTIQLDFLLPERFNLTYIGADGQDNHRPVMLYRGIVGTMERFTTYLIEMYKGAFPTWLAPLQVQIIPVNLGAHGAYAEQIKKATSRRWSTCQCETKDAKMGYLIREAQPIRFLIRWFWVILKLKVKLLRSVSTVKSRQQRCQLLISKLKFWQMLRTIHARRKQIKFKHLTACTSRCFIMSNLKSNC